MKGCDLIAFNTTFSFENFKVIPPPSFEVSFSEIKISPKALFFNTTTVSELDYASHISVFFNPIDYLLVVTPSAKSELSCPFFDPSQTKRNVTLVYEKLTSAIRSTMNWPARKGTYRVPGVRIPEFTQTLLCFDLSLGSCAKKTTKKTDPKAFLAACPNLQELKRPDSKFIPFALPASSAVPAVIDESDPSEKIIDLTAVS